MLRPIRTYIVCLSALLIAACAAPRVAAPAADKTAARFQAIVNALAAPEMEGRGAGTAGLDTARDYVIGRFAEAGLWPAFISPHKGPPRFTQPFDISLGVRVVEQSLSAGDSPAKPGFAFNPLGLSSDGAFAGPAVFVGYGIVDPSHKYDSYRGAAADALRGKVAVAFRYEPQDADGKSRWVTRDTGAPWTPAASLLEKAEWAPGAVALLVVDPPSREVGGALSWTAATIAERRARIPVMHISAAYFRDVLTRAGTDAEIALREFQRRADEWDGPVSKATGVSPLEGVAFSGRVRLEFPRATLANIAGVVPGDGALKDEVIIVGAHYDHLGYGDIGSMTFGAARGAKTIHPGADDNASGAAALTLLASRFASERETPASLPAASPLGRRTLVFVAFSGEERGLLGSRYLVDHLADLDLRREQVVAMLNMDMVGRLRERKLYLMEASPVWMRLARPAGAAAGLDIRTAGWVPGTSDFLPFAAKGIPVISLFTGGHEDYHRPSDTPEKVNSEGGAKVVDFAERLLRVARVEKEFR